jgi:hypothetical protein
MIGRMVLEIRNCVNKNIDFSDSTDFEMIRGWSECSVRANNVGLKIATVRSATTASDPDQDIHDRQIERPFSPEAAMRLLGSGVTRAYDR